MKTRKSYRGWLCIIMLVCLFSCNESKKRNVDSNKNTTVKKSDSIKGLNKEVYSVLIDYIKQNPLNRKYADLGYSEESYYVGFLKIKDDTLFAVFKQPFLMDDIFPERAFRRAPKYLDFSSITVKPKVVGTTLWKNNLIVILDTNNSGINLYDINNLDSVQLEKIKYKTPEEDEIWHPNLYPIWKYYLRHGKLIELSIDDGLIYTNN